MKTVIQKYVYLFSLINTLGVNAKECKHRKATYKMLDRIYFLMLLRYGHSLLRYGQDLILIKSVKSLRYGHF